MEFVNHAQASRLLRDKFVVVLGDSIQRSVYKDIVLLLQKDEFLSLEQLKSKGELSFEQDSLVEGGNLDRMHNGTRYHEVRQYRTQRHHVRFYFLTRIYSPYVQWILNAFHHGLKPDVVIVNSCLWDISRYNNANWLQEYIENLDLFFGGLTMVLPQESLVMWTLTMPVSQTIKAGALLPQMACRPLEWDVWTANRFSGPQAMRYNVDVLDLYSRFTHRQWQRMGDGVHWDHLAHRTITTLILERAAEAWGGAEDDFSSDDFCSDDFLPFGGIIHGCGFHGNADPGGFFSIRSAEAELASPVDSPPSLPSLGSTAGTDSMGGGTADSLESTAGTDSMGGGTADSLGSTAGTDSMGGGTADSLGSTAGTDSMGGGTADSLKPVSTSSRVINGECTATKNIKENGPERTELEENGVLKTVPINEPSKPEQKLSGGNGAHNAEPNKPEQKPRPPGGNVAQKAEPIKPKPWPSCGQKAEPSGSHYYDREGFTEDSVTTHHQFILGYLSFDGDEPQPPHTPRHHRRPPAHSAAAMHGFRYRPYCLPPQIIMSTSQRGWNNKQRNNSYVIRNRKTKRLH